MFLYEIIQLTIEMANSRGTKHSVIKVIKYFVVHVNRTTPAGDLHEVRHEIPATRPVLMTTKTLRRTMLYLVNNYSYFINIQVTNSKNI